MADRVLTHRILSGGVAEEVAVVLRDLLAFYATTDAETARERRAELAAALTIPVPTAEDIDRLLVAATIRRAFPDPAS